MTAELVRLLAAASAEAPGLWAELVAYERAFSACSVVVCAAAAIGFRVLAARAVAAWRASSPPDNASISITASCAAQGHRDAIFALALVCGAACATSAALALLCVPAVLHPGGAALLDLVRR